MGFIERFSELTSERGAVARLAEAIPVSDSLLSKYKRGLAEPSFENAIHIANYYDVSLDWLAGRDGYARDAHRHPAHSPASEIDELYNRMDDDSRSALLTMARNSAALSGVREQSRGRAAEGAVSK